MNNNYLEYMLDETASAEYAVFKLRNAFYGTGVDKYDRMALWLEDVRVKLSEIAYELKSEIETDNKD